MRGLNVKEMKSRIDPRRLIRRRKDPIARAVAAQSQSQQASQQQQQQKSSGGNCAAEVMELLNCMKANDFDDCKCTREKGILTECTRLMGKAPGGETNTIMYQLQRLGAKGASGGKK